MKIGMLFTGYGSQFVGMGKDLYDNSRVVQEYFEDACQCIDINFVKLCFASSDIELSKIHNAYTALFLLGTATGMAIKEAGIQIDCVAGYGVGEYAALCVAGGISFPDGLYLLTKISNFYSDMREDLDAKSVMVNGMTAKKLNQICKEISDDSSQAHIAVYENKTEHVVTGNVEAVNAVIQTVTGDAKVKKNVDFEEGFHTPLLNDLVEQLKIYLTKVDFKDLKIPLITSINASNTKEISDGQKAQDMMMKNIVKPVYWNNIISQFVDFDIIIVPAPSKSLVLELRSYYPEKNIIGIDSIADIDKLKEYLESVKSGNPETETVETVLLSENTNEEQVTKEV